jgi:hypothetical protein
MAVRKTKAGADLKRWFKEKWTDQHGRECGSSKTKGVKKCRPSKSVSKETPVTWKGIGKRKSAVVAEKRTVGMGNRTSSIRKKSKK